MNTKTIEYATDPYFMIDRDDNRYLWSNEGSTDGEGYQGVRLFKENNDGTWEEVKGLEDYITLPDIGAITGNHANVLYFNYKYSNGISKISTIGTDPNGRPQFEQDNEIPDNLPRIAGTWPSDAVGVGTIIVNEEECDVVEYKVVDGNPAPIKDRRQGRVLGYMEPDKTFVEIDRWGDWFDDPTWMAQTGEITQNNIVGKPTIPINSHIEYNLIDMGYPAGITPNGGIYIGNIMRSNTNITVRRVVYKPRFHAYLSFLAK